jgi:glycosyltransferase involved in cell wall biosynthesis
MRILHLVHQYAPDKVGGTELYTKTVAEFQAKTGHRAAVFTPTAVASPFPEPEIVNDVRLYRVPIGPRSAGAVFRSNWRQWKLSRAWTAVLDQEQPDIVHIQHLMGLPFNLGWALWTAEIPYLITLHDYFYFCANAQLLTNDTDQICAGPRRGINCGRCALARAGLPAYTPLAAPLAPLFVRRNQLLREIVQQAERLIAPTEFVRQLYIQAGFPPEKTITIGHGIELPPKLNRPERPAGGPLRLLYAGGLAWQKGVHLLITAVNQLPAEAVTLTIAGDPAAFPAYSQTLREMARQSDNIHFAGKLDRRQLWAALAAADLVVVPSLWHETASLIIQEAFAAGTPVIAARVGALPERVNDGVDGLLFPVGDGDGLRNLLVRLRNDPALLERLRRGIRPVRTAAEHLVELEAVYQGIVEK